MLTQKAGKSKWVWFSQRMFLGKKLVDAAASDASQQRSKSVLAVLHPTNVQYCIIVLRHLKDNLREGCGGSVG